MSDIPQSHGHQARGFLRLQLVLALAALPETPEEGITSLRYGFDFHPLFIPLTNLALGRTYEAAGKPDRLPSRTGRSFVSGMPPIRSCSRG